MDACPVIEMIIPHDKLHAAFNLIKKEANGSIDATKTLILVAEDADSVAATRIFVALLQQEFIRHEVKSVGSYEALVETKALLSKDLVAIVFINCGGFVDLGALFEFADGLTFYVIDSHLPYDPKNVDDENVVCHSNPEYNICVLSSRCYCSMQLEARYRESNLRKSQKFLRVKSQIPCKTRYSNLNKEATMDELLLA